jgi:hypothetical protein
LLVDTLWNPLEYFTVPAHIFKSGKLTLTFAELSVYLIACKKASVYQSGCCIQLPLLETARLTGYATSKTHAAIAELQSKGLLRQLYGEREHDKTGKFENIEYTICDTQGAGLFIPSQPVRRRVGLRARLHGAKEPYFSMPACIADYLKELRGAPLAVYVGAVRLCNLAGRREIATTKAELRRVSGVATNRTLNAAIDYVLYPCDGDHRNFLEITGTKKLEVTLTNPSDPQSLPLDYYEITEQQTGKSTTRRKEYSDDLLLRWAASAIWNGATPDALKLGSNGDHLGTCPMCGGANAKRRGVPTLAINVARRSAQNSYGIYFCHSCGAGAGETLLDLVIQRTGLNVIKAMASLDKLKSETQRAGQ